MVGLMTAAFSLNLLLLHALTTWALATMAHGHGLVTGTGLGASRQQAQCGKS
jgi:hypothetical protein